MIHLEGLNEKQQEAVNYQKGPLLIVAGAGTGKTKTIISRIIQLIESGVDPASILAVTFTNKAAEEMRERLKQILKTSLDTIPFISTFHALGVYILRQHARQIGLNRHFTVLDRDDSIRQLKTAMTQIGLDPKQIEPRKILNSISRIKGKGMTAKQYQADLANDYFSKITSVVWLEYEKQLEKVGALDFDDLLLKTVNLFKKHPDILTSYQNRWLYIHIDEYQDTNQIQYLLSKMLALKNKNICVVGDNDQSIYSWRGADFTNILNFSEDYPQAKTIILEENYRSSKNILSVANKIIAKNSNRIPKNLFTKSQAGELISVYSAFNESDEANFIANKVTQLLQQKIPAENIAILYRANFQSRALEEGFLKAGLPYQVLGTRFFDRKEIKDILAFIKLALNPDDFESLKRIINLPKKGIGKLTILAIASGQEASLPAKTQAKISAFRKLITEIKNNILSQSVTLSEVIKFIIEKSDFKKDLRTGTEDDQERLENIKELVTLATKYNHLSAEDGALELLTEAALLSDQDNLKKEHQAVRLMTVHASKGLEFAIVFIAGLEDKLFPHQMASNEEAHDDEEERRLFYVALTRAQQKLFLSFAQVRTIYGLKQSNLPSEFLLDLPDDHLLAEKNEEENVIYLNNE